MLKIDQNFTIQWAVFGLFRQYQHADRNMCSKKPLNLSKKLAKSVLSIVDPPSCS